MTERVAALAERVRDARRNGESLRIVGGGSWLDAGHPCSARKPLELSELTGITTYEPGDLTLTALAGTRLDEIERATATHGQWLALDPVSASSATIGATIATASSGPLASAFGTPRDQVLGCEFITGAGDVVRAGGRVVKNVAGFDLVRLATGAWGSIGAITEVSVRLRARPEVERTVAIRLPDDDVDRRVSDAWRWLRSSEFTPYAVELLSPTLAEHLALGKATTLLLRFGGNASLVEAAERDAASLGDASDATHDVWARLRAPESTELSVFRASTRASRIGALWTRALEYVSAREGWAHASLGRGVVRCAFRNDVLAADAALTALARDFTVIGERIPVALWALVQRSSARDQLASRVRNAFDPDGVLNPGILGPQR